MINGRPMVMMIVSKIVNFLFVTRRALPSGHALLYLKKTTMALRINTSLHRPVIAEMCSSIDYGLY